MSTNKCGYTISDWVVMKAESGHQALKIENSIKRQFESLDRIGVVGFKIENCSIKNYKSVITYITEWV